MRLFRNSALPVGVPRPLQLAASAGINAATMAEPSSPSNVPPANTRYVLITGASTGIGHASAVHLAQLGFHVLAGVRSEADAARLRESCTTGGCICPVNLDVTCDHSIAEAAQQVQSVVGDVGLSGLVNNAGISISGPVECVTLADWRRQFEVNVFGQIAVTQAVLPLLRKRVAAAGRGSARIVMMSSVAGKVAQPISGPYNASKFALEAISDSLRLELRGQGIAVCVIEPGAIATPFWNKGNGQLPKEEWAQQLYGRQVEGVRAAMAKVVASAIAPEAVATAVGACLTQRRPKIRYPVGRDAHAGVLSRRFMPDRFFDFVLGRFYHIP